MPDHSIAISRITIEVDLHTTRTIDGRVVSNPITRIELQADGEAKYEDVANQNALRGLVITDIRFEAYHRIGRFPLRDNGYVVFRGMLTAVDNEAIARALLASIAAVHVAQKTGGASDA